VVKLLASQSTVFEEQFHWQLFQWTFDDFANIYNQIQHIASYKFGFQIVTGTQTVTFKWSTESSHDFHGAHPSILWKQGSEFIRWQQYFPITSSFHLWFHSPWAKWAKHTFGFATGFSKFLNMTWFSFLSPHWALFQLILLPMILDIYGWYATFCGFSVLFGLNCQVGWNVHTRPMESDTCRGFLPWGLQGIKNATEMNAPIRNVRDKRSPLFEAT
jgi:hypothetical protein